MLLTARHPRVSQVGKTYTVHFTGSNPQTLRLLMPDAEEGEKVLVRIYYQTKSRLQVSPLNSGVRV